MPFVRPDTVQLAVAETQPADGGDDVTVYPVMGEPPSDVGAVHET